MQIIGRSELFVLVIGALNVSLSKNCTDGKSSNTKVAHQMQILNKESTIVQLAAIAKLRQK